MPENGPITSEPFGTDEILWWNNGRWGEAGYAIANPGGKVWTNNQVIFAVHQLVGRELFALMHMPDVKFTRPPSKQFLWAIDKATKVAIKRLRDREVDFNDDRFDPQHATPVPKTFLCYPVPYFGERIRQVDAAEYCTLMLLALSEMMQHSDNEFQLEVTSVFVGHIENYFARIQYLMATKFFNKSRDEVQSETWVGLTEADFSAYDPTSLHTESELVEERPPLRWWPTENDLSEIRAKPITALLEHAQRWPSTEILMTGDGGSEAVVPRGGNLEPPTARRQPGGPPPAI